jgi:hypothetical protein
MRGFSHAKGIVHAPAPQQRRTRRGPSSRAGSSGARRDVEERLQPSSRIAVQHDVSIAARCVRTGMMGIVSSSSPAVAVRYTCARAHVGAAGSQDITDPMLRPSLLDLMALGAGYYASAAPSLGVPEDKQSPIPILDTDRDLGVAERSVIWTEDVVVGRAATPASHLSTRPTLNRGAAQRKLQSKEESLRHGPTADYAERCQPTGSRGRRSRQLFELLLPPADRRLEPLLARDLAKLLALR